ncbi:MAG: DEAD/DEAH box helicase, partial [Thaumarchaeota archaeon]|nr:DEAD/DEAH box helicase [Nitrososphaerota archaeon]
MMRYPLEVIGATWEERLAELERFEAKRETMATLESKEAPPALFNGTLRDFQKQGLDFLLKSGGVALLADEMGLGKTVETLAYLVSEADAFPVLVVAPLVTLMNWRREIHRFTRRSTGDIPSVALIRTGRPAMLPPSDFYIINYELLWKRREDLVAAGVRTIVADEVQNLRNRATVKYEAITEIAGSQSVKHRLGLSGTPCYNHGLEIWSIADFLYPGLLGSYNEFAREFVAEWSGEVMESKREALYEMLTESIMLRRRKVDVMKELPPKTRYRQRVEVDRAYYEREMRTLVDKINSQVGLGNTSLSLIEQQRTALANGERMVAGVSKVPQVVEFVEEMMELEEPVVVYAHHLVVHQLLREKLSKFYPVSIIGGQTDAVRQNEIDRFQEGHSKLMVAALRAGNLGINLTAAAYVVFAELDWSPAIHRQAEDRLHRIGQEKPVFAYYLEGAGTYDEHIAGLLVDKKLELDSIFGDAPDGTALEVAKADLMGFVGERLGTTLDSITQDAKARILLQREEEEERKKKEEGSAEA